MQDIQRYVSHDLMGQATPQTRAAEGIAWVRGWDDYNKNPSPKQADSAAAVSDERKLA